VQLAQKPGSPGVRCSPRDASAVLHVNEEAETGDGLAPLPVATYSAGTPWDGATSKEMSSALRTVKEK